MWVQLTIRTVITVIGFPWHIWHHNWMGFMTLTTPITIHHHEQNFRILILLHLVIQLIGKKFSAERGLYQIRCGIRGWVLWICT